MHLPALEDTLGDQIVAEMCDQLKEGFTLVDIAAYQGLDVEALYRAYHTNQGGLRERLDRAAMECKLRHLKRVNTGAINYQSSTWFLERKYKDEWGKDKAGPTTPDGQEAKQTWLVNGKELSF